MFWTFYFVAFIIGICVVWHFYSIDKEQEQQFEQLEELEQLEVQGDPESPVSTETEISSEADEEEELHTTKKKDVAKIKGDNPDWIGWVKIDGTSISYPVMQRAGDNEYYLHRDFYGNSSFYGTPFLDLGCNADSDNCIIYGHNINGGRMFGALHAFNRVSYYNEHPKVSLRLGKTTREYEILAVIPTTIENPLYSFTEVGNWEEYKNYVSMMVSKSLYQTQLGKKITKELMQEEAQSFFKKYQFVSLSTCRSWIGRDARLLVIAARES